MKNQDDLFWSGFALASSIYALAIALLVAAFK